MQAVQIHNGFFLVFERGEDLMPTLLRFCEENEVHWAQFQAIGTLEDVEIGYYDLPSRRYVFRSEEGPFEVACIGGHLRSARVALTLELCLWQVTQPLTRSRDDETGLDLINFAV